jgi:hypothetical protein
VDLASIPAGRPIHGKRDNILLRYGVRWGVIVCARPISSFNSLFLDLRHQRVKTYSFRLRTLQAPHQRYLPKKKPRLETCKNSAKHIDLDLARNCLKKMPTKYSSPSSLVSLYAMTLCSRPPNWGSRTQCPSS